MRPLSLLRAKVLCPVLDRPLIDHALDHLAAVVEDLAVNVHADRAGMEAHLSGRVHLSFETELLGTAGALGGLRGWLDGRAALVVNGDTWCPASLAPLLDGWDGETLRVMVSGRDALHSRSRIVGSLVPEAIAASLEVTPAGLWERLWRSAVAAGTVQTIHGEGPFADCATVADYLAANLLALRHGGMATFVGRNAVVDSPISDAVIGAGAWVRRRLERAVVWPGVEVGPGAGEEGVVLASNGHAILVR